MKTTCPVGMPAAEPLGTICPVGMPAAEPSETLCPVGIPAWGRRAYGITICYYIRIPMEWSSFGRVIKNVVPSPSLLLKLILP